MGRPRFDPAEYRRTLERVAQREGFGDSPAIPGFDPKQHAELMEAAAQGRKPEDYRQVMEAHGFLRIPAGVMLNGRPVPQAIWRREWPELNLKYAFTDQDLVTGYRGPEDFDAWLREQIHVRRIKANIRA